MKFLVLLFPITLIIQGFENDNGKAFVRIRNAEGKEVKAFVLDIKKGTAQWSGDIGNEKTIAIDAFHDENNNKKLDTNTFGAPKEDWGISGSSRPTFRAPTLQEMLIPVKSGQTIRIKVD